MIIDDLLNRYFEGETSCEEERQLRAFFASSDVPEHLVVYKPLFAYFDEEIKKEQLPEEIKYKESKHIWFTRKSVFYILSGVAACVLAIVGITRIYMISEPCPCTGNYVVINGRCYTDMHKVRSFAVEALREVATSPDECFPQNEDMMDREIVDSQLRELGNIFSEDE